MDELHNVPDERRQLTSDDLKTMSPAQISAAVDAGLCDELLGRKPTS